VRALVIAALVSIASLAGADDTDKERVKQAKTYFEIGTAAIDEGKFAVAITAFEEAYRLDPRPSVVYALAFSYRQQWILDGDSAKLKRAVTLLREYVDLPKADKRAKAIDYLAEMEPELALVEAEQAKAGAGPVAEAVAEKRTVLILSSPEPGAKIAIDGGEPIELPAVIETTHGTHPAVATAEGSLPTKQDLVAVEGQAVAVTVKLDPEPARLTVRAEAGARVAIDGTVAGGAGEELVVPPGRHQISVLRRGRYAWERELELGKGADEMIVAQLTETTQRRVSRGLLYGAAGAGAAGLVATVFALVEQSTADDIAERRDSGMPLTFEDRDTFNRALDARNAWRTTSIVLFGLAAAAAGTGVFLYLDDDPRPGLGFRGTF
jgi:hypothetical protein